MACPGVSRLAIGITAAVWTGACHNPVSPAPDGEGIVIYVDQHYAGAWEGLNTDVKDLELLDGPCRRMEADGERLPSWGDCISSVRVNPGWTATLYQHDSFKGQSFTLTADAPDLDAVRGPCNGHFNDCVSSIRISKVQ
jgi:hypothetical protein